MNYLKMLLLLVVLASCKQSTTNEQTDLAHAKTDNNNCCKKGSFNTIATKESDR